VHEIILTHRLTTRHVDTNNNALIRVDVAVQELGSLELLLGVLDQVFAEVLRLVVACDLSSRLALADYST
jgi:hypothetical protein